MSFRPPSSSFRLASWRALVASALRRVPKLVRLLALHGLFGLLIGTLVTAGLILTNTANIGIMLANSGWPPLVILLLWAGLSITFAGLAMTSAIMRMPWGAAGTTERDQL